MIFLCCSRDIAAALFGALPAADDGFYWRVLAATISFYQSSASHDAPNLLRRVFHFARAITIFAVSFVCECHELL